MRVVIDTSVLVSAAIRDRLPERVVLWCVAQPDVEWLVSAPIMTEYFDVIRRPKFALSEATTAWWYEFLSTHTTVIDTQRDLEFPKDRKDAPFLTCAAFGNADYLITGDGDFGAGRKLIQALIVTAREFAQAVAPELLSD